MPDRSSSLKAFLTELKRRKVYRVAMAYAAASFVVWQAAEIAVPALGLPDSILRFIVVASLLGFPVAVVLAWVYELRPEATGEPERLARVRHGAWPIAAAAGVILVAGFAAYRALVPSDGVSGPLRVALFPFASIPADGNPLGEGVADLVSIGLDGTPGLTAVDPRALWPPILQAGLASSGGVEEDRYLAESRQFGASHFVTGTVMSTGEHLQITLRVNETGGGEQVGTIRASSPRDSLARLVDQVAVDLVAVLWPAEEIPAVGRVDEHATSDPQALNAYLEAMAHFRRGGFDQASEAIDRAVAEDTTFALAHMAQFRIRSWTLSLEGMPQIGLREIIDRAVAHGERLTRRNRLRVEAYRALDDTDATRAAFLFERILEIDPTDADALASLAGVHATYYWMLERPWSDVRAMLDQAIALDTANVPLLYLSGLESLLRGDLAGAGADAVRMEQVGPASPVTKGFRAGWSLLAAANTDSVARTMLDLEPTTLIGALRLARMIDLDRAERLAVLLRDSAAQVTSRQAGFGVALQAAAARGRAEEVEAAAHAPTTNSVLQAQLHRYVVGMALTGLADPGLSAHAAEALVASAPVDSLAWAVDNRAEAWAAAWAVGAHHAAFGDTAVARSYVEALLALPGGGIIPQWHESVAAGIESRIALRRGDMDAALAAASRAYRLWIIHNPDGGGWYPEPAMRFELAERLREAGRQEESEWLYRSFLAPHWTSFYTMLAQRRLAER